MKKGRNVVFDMMKGIAIIAVIIGHLNLFANVNDYFELAKRFTYFNIAIRIDAKGWFFYKIAYIRTE